MQIGLVGLPLCGKTTFFNLLTGATCDTGFSGVEEVNTGSALVPDERLQFLANLYRPRKTSHARIQFKDIPGLGSAKCSPGQIAKLMDEVRSADALVQVVRAFSSPEIEAATGPVSPFRELKDFASELMITDMETVEKRIARIKNLRKIPKETAAQLEVLEKILEGMENEQPLHKIELTATEWNLMADHVFLSEKPLILVINIDEEQLIDGDYPNREQIMAYAKSYQIPVVEVCALTEMEISQLPAEDRPEFMADLGLNESGISRLARAAYECLGLISFFTVGEDEVRAWPIHQRTKASRAAGKIHSDIERGFIRAEVFHYNDMKALGTTAQIKEKGLFRLEGKAYTVQDGDIISYRFNV